ncbi:MAG: hypothetical protein OEU36_21805, partial [Gammaproteobacteria bacterium]|nr:hypothetical protein [Gammaproteobacteria bacterium]
MQLNCGNIHEQCAISPPRVLREIQDDLRSAGVVPTLNPTTGALLRTLAVSHPSGVFLQLGVGSCELVAWIADGMDITSRLVTVVVDPTLRNILKHHLGDDIRMAFHNQNELEFLIDVHRHRFHLIVIDCVLAGVRLVRAASETVAAGGLLVITDIVADGAECPEAR